MKNSLYSLLLIGGLFFTAAFKVRPEKTNFSGTWVLNISKSDFGDSPTYVLQKQLDITDNSTSIKIKYTATTEAGADSVFVLTYSQGKVLDNLTAEKRTQHFKFMRPESDDFTLEHSSSFPQKPDSEEYHTFQQFHISADRKQLTLDKQVKVYNGYAYTVKGVYEKK
ncbi:hypothetical protein KXD93_04880 [Mucilaginibacter sp. BJC16-A38]|uniref:hypothetical protein n=1 Tax=Mucilaginibacter phenanthrenivorans TaxID=1234842 RepID=UPI00215851E0|nr:hypothetical protein [Mucilaginibacter phenanthrenivorans]MCR8556961.1 hypothetical protein [Mucilaginibacter phenanthrenivorans]